MKIDVFVQPVVVMNNCRTYLRFGHRKPDGITYVVKHNWINDLIKKQRTILSLKQINLISNFLKEYKNENPNILGSYERRYCIYKSRH